MNGGDRELGIRGSLQERRCYRNEKRKGIGDSVYICYASKKRTNNNTWLILCSRGVSGCFGGIHKLRHKLRGQRVSTKCDIV